jgi:hypothetical protein
LPDASVVVGLAVVTVVPPLVFTVNNPPVNGDPLTPIGLLVIVILVAVLETSVGALAVPGRGVTAVDVVIEVDPLVVLP